MSDMLIAFCNQAGRGAAHNANICPNPKKSNVFRVQIPCMLGATLPNFVGLAACPVAAGPHAESVRFNEEERASRTSGSAVTVRKNAGTQGATHDTFAGPFGRAGFPWNFEV